jgi:signal transduction histidine kinase
MMNPATRALDRRPALRAILTALKDPFTYNLRRNIFTLFGFLWGLPLSAVMIILDLWVIGHPQRLLQFWREPVHLLFLIHPFVFAVVFGAMGTVHAGQDGKIEGLLEEQRRNLDDLKKVDELKSQFMANVTHELKTPLVAIKGYVESILEERFGPLTDKQRGGLRIAARNVARLQNLIQEILEFERIDSHAYEPHASDFDLVALVRLTLSNFQPQIEEKQLALQTALPEHLEVRADYEGIRRVLNNLESNAVKFSGKGAAIGVEIRPGGAATEIEVEVWDRGPGIPPEAQGNLFTRFWQADGSSRRRYGGTGLGLAIVKGILDAHGSAVRVSSTPGAGTSIRFPLKRTPGPAPVVEAVHGAGAAAHSDR